MVLLRDMSTRDQAIARAMIETAARYIGFDYEVRLGVSREQSAKVVANWPPEDETGSAVRLTINNSMNEVCHAVRFPGGWPDDLAFSKDEARDVFSRWLGREFRIYPVQDESLFANEHESIQFITATGSIAFEKTCVITSSSTPADLGDAEGQSEFHDIPLGFGHRWTGRAGFYGSAILDVSIRTLSP